MESSVNIPQKAPPRWVYAELTVFDGQRQLRPTEVGPDEVSFDQPPHIAEGQIEILLTNRDEHQRHLAEVLPHDANATDIPIRLVKLLSH